ncbi:MAG: PQQ-binding-like beta-propeller repeat protein [Erysipelotrichaceae bacterium]|nr:PQQ-binding-like beta-propeller repeat protein [Erysipelotrichaceae bacterium]
MKRLLTFFVTLSMMFSLFSVSVFAQDDTMIVSLRVEGVEETYYYNEEVEVSADSYMTCEDVLKASGIEYTSVDSSYGSYVTSICGYYGNGWMYAIDDNTSYSIVDGSQVVYYPYEDGNNYTYFTSDSYTMTIGSDLEIELIEQVYDENWNIVDAPCAYAQIYYKTSPTGEETALQSITDENGKTTISFNEAGTYYLTAKSLTGEYLSRSFSSVIVTGDTIDTSAIDSSIASIEVVNETTNNISLPTYTNDYNCSISWSSNNEDILNSDGIVNNSSLDEETYVLLTATFYQYSDGSTKIVQYLVKVLPDTSDYDAGSLSTINGSWLNSNYNNAITSTTTPLSSSDTNLKYLSSCNYKSSPIIVGDYIYVVNGSNQLVKLNQSDGSIVSTANLSSSLYYSADIIYGDGIIFVPLSNGTIQAFNADNLASLWISESAGNAVTSMLTYYNGYLYAGTVNSFDNGIFFAIDVNDEDTSTGKEMKELAWTYASTGSRTGYYSNQAMVINDQLYFVGDDGILVCHSLTEDKVISTLTLDTSVRSGMTYDDNYMYMMSMSSTLYKISIADLTVENQVQIYEDGYSTSTPTLYNGRIYVGGLKDNSDFYGTGFMAVIDASSMDVIAISDTVANVQSQPLVTIAYANEDNLNSVIAYFTCNTYPGGVYYIEDYEGNTSITVNTLYTPDSVYQQYNMNNVVVDDEGTLYFVNDSGTLFALENTNSNSSIAAKEIVEETNTNTTKTSTNEMTDSSVNVVETGDETNMTIYIVIGGIAVIAIVVLLFMRKKNR